MEISAAQVKELRDKTGCPIIDCKKALEEAGGDLAAAIDVLRKRGVEGAAKRKDPATSEGVLAGALDPKGTRGALVELLCESDFVARNDGFRALAQELADALLRSGRAFASAEAFLDAEVPGKGAKVRQRILDVQNALKENMRIGRIAVLEGGPGTLGDVYVHFNGKIGAIVLLELGATALSDKPEVKELARDLCMQVASTNPVAVSRDSIPPDVVEKERRIVSEMDDVKAKPEKVRPKIIEGKMARFFADSALLEQEFVKEKMAVRELVKRVGAQAGGSLSVQAFVRLEVGKA